MMRDLMRLIERVEIIDTRMRETGWNIDRLKHGHDFIVDFINLQFEATEPEYQDRLWLLGLDDIKKYTLAEVESARFMSEKQFDLLRSSK